MNVDKLLIAMCDQATEIQNKWEKKHGDLIYNKCSKSTMLYGRTRVKIDSEGMYATATPRELFWTTKDIGPWGTEHAVWIPSQEQLQEMIDWQTWKRHYYMQLGGCPVYDKFYPAMVILDNQDTVRWTSNDSIRSWNQLWLSFVMWELYDKLWNGMEWVICKDF